MSNILESGSSISENKANRNTLQRNFADFKRRKLASHLKQILYENAAEKKQAIVEGISALSNTVDEKTISSVAFPNATTTQIIIPITSTQINGKNTLQDKPWKEGDSSESVADEFLIDYPEGSFKATAPKSYGPVFSDSYDLTLSFSPSRVVGANSHSFQEIKQQQQGVQTTYRTEVTLTQPGVPFDSLSTKSPSFNFPVPTGFIEDRIPPPRARTASTTSKVTSTSSSQQSIIVIQPPTNSSSLSSSETPALSLLITSSSAPVAFPKPSTTRIRRTRTITITVPIGASVITTGTSVITIPTNATLTKVPIKPNLNNLKYSEAKAFKVEGVQSVEQSDDSNNDTDELVDFLYYVYEEQLPATDASSIDKEQASKNDLENNLAKRDFSFSQQNIDSQFHLQVRNHNDMFLVIGPFENNEIESIFQNKKEDHNNDHEEETNEKLDSTPHIDPHELTIDDMNMVDDEGSLVFQKRADFLKGMNY